MALDFFAGCLGGCAGVIVGHPFDTVKVHLQTQDARNPLYRGTMDCFRSLVAKNGFTGLYRGVSSPLTGVAAINAIIFGVYGNVQRRSADPDSLKSHFFAGAAAGFAQSAFCSPMELAKTRIQLLGHGSPIQCLRDIHKMEGFRGVFRGLGITVCREIPGFSTYFVSYELMTRSSDNAPVSTLKMLLAGGFAGTFSWIITYPIDVLKSRLQADGMTGSPKYTGAIDCLRKSIHSEGYKFLTRGLTSTILRAFPTNAACFTVVTWTFRLCNGEVEQKQDNHTYHLSEISQRENVFDLLAQTFGGMEKLELLATH